MIIVAHVNRRTLYIILTILTISFFGLMYSHLFSATFQSGLYYNLFGEWTPYIGYVLLIVGGQYFASMLWSDQAYLTSDGTDLIEFRGSKIKLCEISDINLTRKGFGIQNITIYGNNRTINLRSHMMQEDSVAIVEVIKKLL